MNKVYWADINWLNTFHTQYSKESISNTQSSGIGGYENQKPCGKKMETYPPRTKFNAANTSDVMAVMLV